MGLGELVQLHLTATIVDVSLILVAVFIAVVIGLPLMWFWYAIVGTILLGIIDIAYRVRRSVGYILGMKLGTIQQENAALRQNLTEAQREQKQASSVLDSLSRRNVDSVPSVQVTRNYVPYDKSVEHQQYIDDALLIFDTAMHKGGSAASRESMCPGVMSQDRWEGGRDWLVGARVLIYKTHKTKVWATTDRRVARGMLHIYSDSRKEKV